MILPFPLFKLPTVEENLCLPLHIQTTVAQMEGLHVPENCNFLHQFQEIKFSLAALFITGYSSTSEPWTITMQPVNVSFRAEGFEVYTCITNCTHTWHWQRMLLLPVCISNLHFLISLPLRTYDMNIMHFICGKKHLYHINVFPPEWKNESTSLMWCNKKMGLTWNDCPRARKWFSQLVTQENCGNKTHSRCEACYVWTVWQGQAVLKSLWAGLYISCWELPAGAQRRGQWVDQLLTHGNRGSKIGHVLVSSVLFQICRNQ